MKKLSSAHTDISRIRSTIIQKQDEYLESVAMNFLEEARQEIQDQNLLDSYDMHDSFYKGNLNNVYEKDGRTITAGTSVYYSKFVNEGHWTVNRTSFVEPTHFYDIALYQALQKSQKHTAKDLKRTIKKTWRMT